MLNQIKSNHSAPPENLLLAQLPAAERQLLAEHLELVSLPMGHVLHEPGESLSHAYFPTDCAISLRYIVESGDSTELAIIGKEGMIGTALFTGGQSTTSRAVLQSAGHAYRLKASVLQSEFSQDGPLSKLLMKLSASMITQMVQNAASNQRRSFEATSQEALADAGSKPATEITTH